MTTVYGVTYIGARDQIEKQLKDRKDIPDEDTWGASAYLAKKVFIIAFLLRSSDTKFLKSRSLLALVTFLLVHSISRIGSISARGLYRNPSPLTDYLKS